MADQRPLLSILLPTHNRADVLPFAIQSVLAQSLADFELLVVGDGCTDGTAAVVEALASTDARIRWFDLPKAPHFGYANRNVALREARGQFIGFMAHDDLVTSDHFARLVAAMADPAAHLVHSASAWVGSWGEIVPALFHLADRRMRAELLAGRWNRLPATAFLYRQEAITRVGLWNEELKCNGDMDLWSRIILAYGEDAIRVVDEFTVFHFRAVWRTQDRIAPDNEPLWRRLHDEAGRLDPMLRVPPLEGQKEQATFWSWMQRDAARLADTRAALTRAMQSFAWEIEVRSGANRHDFLEATDATHGELERLRARCDRLRLELDRTKEQLTLAKAARKQASKPRRFWERWLAGKTAPSFTRLDASPERARDDG